MKELKMRHSGIVKILDIGDGFIVLENCYKYPEGVSNLYKVDYSFNPLWEAELKQYGYKFSTDHFTNVVLNKNDGSLNAFGGSTTYTLDPTTGKILKETFTK